MAGNNGPWGGGSNGDGSNQGGGRGGSGGGGRKPGGPNDPQIPEIDEIVRKGQEQLRVLMGGRGGNGGSGGDGGGDGFKMTRGAWIIAGLAAVAMWFFASFYTVAPEERGVELFLGEYYRTTDDGPHLAPWPFVRATVLPTSTERTEQIGIGRSGDGLMLTTDENVVDIDFEVVWNIADPARFLFNLACEE